ncbi:MAG TPA: glycosyltransferase [Kiritimatiellia bacterium]|nr:glycosyltransferase [Kiritimatiellia bacterium]HMO98752.1 glycosyltransferase [Kiritimatiellia bacterium]HMP95928.1 glycosyltransferase [Kiritimatiellia bacterium]
MLVSIIVVTFNEAKALPVVKAAFDRLRRPEGLEVETIAVDGGSRDDSVALARELGFTRVLECPGASIPVCRNAGMREAHGAWIAFVDGDCVLDPDWLEQAARLLHAHPALILGWPASPPSPGTWVQRAWHAHWMHKNPAVEMENGVAVVKRDGFRLLTTRNMIFHRAVAERLGGFDESLTTGEDTDFVFRATMADLPAWGLPAMKSTHLGEPDTLRKFYKQQVWHANRRAYKTILEKSGMKHGGNAPIFTLVFTAGVVAAVGGLLLAFWFPPAALGLAPLPVLLLGLAMRTSRRARRPGLIVPLAILYAAYGWARMIDLIGLSPHKPSWKK